MKVFGSCITCGRITWVRVTIPGLAVMFGYCKEHDPLEKKKP